MARVDIPTLQCDRCKTTTQDTRVMGTYRVLTYYHMSGTDEWDLCEDCWADFLSFVESK